MAFCDACKVFDKMGERMFGKVVSLGGLICVGNDLVVLRVKKDGDLALEVSLGGRFMNLGRKLCRASLGRKRCVCF